MTVTLTKHIGEIYISFEGETAADVVELYRGYRDVEAAHAVTVSGDTPLVEVPDEDWIEWNGGERPVDDPETLINYKMRGGGTGDHDPAGALDWSHTGGIVDIVAYRVVQP